jgi:hypothetical protein
MLMPELSFAYFAKRHFRRAYRAAQWKAGLHGATVATSDIAFQYRKALFWTTNGFVTIFLACG